jgi:hypothetical protein
MAAGSDRLRRQRKPLQPSPSHVNRLQTRSHADHLGKQVLLVLRSPQNYCGSSGSYVPTFLAAESTVH